MTNSENEAVEVPTKDDSTTAKEPATPQPVESEPAPKPQNNPQTTAPAEDPVAIAITGLQNAIDAIPEMIGNSVKAAMPKYKPAPDNNSKVESAPTAQDIGKQEKPSTRTFADLWFGKKN